MSDSQDAKNERRLQERMRSMRESGYDGIDDDTMYRLATNNPAGFGDMAAVSPGTALTPQQVAQVVGFIGQPGYFEDGDGMTVERYLSDPRAAIRVENGQYVYRPELMKGDFIAKDRETLMESLGAFPFVLSAFAAPFAASLGAASAASGTGAAGGAMDMGVGIGGDLGSWGGITPIAEGSAATAAGGGFVEQALKKLGTKALTETAMNLLRGGGSDGAVEPTIGNAVKAPVADTGGVSLNLGPSNSKALQMLSGGSLYDDAGKMRGGLITPYLKGA